MIELLLIKHLLDKQTYLRYYKYVKITNKELLKVYYIIKILQETATTDQSTVADLATVFFTEYPFTKPAEKELYETLFTRMDSIVLDESRLDEYLNKQRSMVSATNIAELALEVSQGIKDFSELLNHIDDLDLEKPHEVEDVFVSNILSELYEKQVATPGLRWRLASLNKSLGSLRRGDFGFIFARPETGKTTFLASEITYMAEQANGPILWFNNEEQGEKVSLRCIQASAGYSQASLFNDMPKQEAEYLRRTKNNIKIVDDAGLSKHDVERICKTYAPSLIVFDQIDKLKGFSGDRNDLLLGNIYIWARELAKTYAPVIGVCQADGNGEGVKYLHMGHVANAKTAKQAEADWIIGIGKSNDEDLAYVRHFNISKNKLQGDSDSLSEMRHGQFDCLLKPEIARYEDFA